MANEPKTTVSRTVITPTFRMSYPKLVTPEPFVDKATGRPKGDPVFGMEMIFEPAELAKFKMWDDEKGTFLDVDAQRLGVELCKELWGADFSVKEAVKHGGLAWPFKNGDAIATEKGKKGEHYKGTTILRGKALSVINNKPNAPRLYFTEGGKRKEIARGTDAGNQRANQLFYGGAYAIAELSMVAGSTAQGKYVTTYINSVKFVKDGERLGGGSLMDRFDGIHGGQAAHDPTTGMDDEIPF